MESITPSIFLGPLNEPLGIDAESEGSMVNPQAGDDSDHRQVVDTAGRTRPRDVDLKDNIQI